MDILMSETCWAHNKRNKIASDIKLVFHSSTNIRFWSYLAQFFLEWNMFRTKVVEKVKTQISCSIMISEYHATYDMKWRNILERCILQMTIWRMHITCWISKATNTLSEYVTLNAFPLQQWLHGRVSVLSYTYIVACLKLFLFFPPSFLWIINWKGRPMWKFY